MNIIVLFPVDLYHNVSKIKKYKVFLVEETHYFNRSSDSEGNMKFNILKSIYHRATMKCYFDYLLSKNIDATYIELNKDWTKIINNYVNNKKATLFFYDPVDRMIDTKIKNNFESYEIFESPRFILSHNELQSYDGTLRQTSFYSWIRKNREILMTKSKNTMKPIGGKLSYDKENRKKPYDGIANDIDDTKNYNNNKYVVEALKYVINNFEDDDIQIKNGIKLKDVKNFNDLDLILKFPIDRKSSIARLQYFIKYNLCRFGDYQDVILNNSDNSFIFHSALSPMINIGILTPVEVINMVLKYYNHLSNKDKLKRIKDVEGFIRQILGWREFVRYMYQYHSSKYMNKNYFNAKKRLTKQWYDGTTGYKPVDLCIDKAFRYGYLHHIERLMIIANNMTLNGIHPKEMYKWFMEFSLDSYDWVMEFNVYCMASYSDGGKFVSKPYISTSRYILNMSNYENNNDKWIEKWNALFWKFLKKHKNKIKKIGRLSMLLKYL